MNELIIFWNKYKNIIITTVLVLAYVIIIDNYGLVGGLIITAIVMGATIWFMVKYREQIGKQVATIAESTKKFLEDQEKKYKKGEQ